MHSGLILFLWLLAVVLISFLDVWPLALCVLVLLMGCIFYARERTVRLLRRVRLLLLMISLFFVFLTPGMALWAALPEWSPTYEGLLLAGLHGGRLLALVMAVALLLEYLPPPRLVGALYAWLWPISGFYAERIAIRIMLVLREIEYGDIKKWRHWLVEGEMLLPESALEPIILPRQVLSVTDKLVLLALIVALAAWIFWQMNGL